MSALLHLVYSDARLLDDGPLVLLRTRKDPRVGDRARVTRPASSTDGLALRVSVLEQCQLRCLYCAPAQGTGTRRDPRWLTPDEHARIAPLFVAAGVRKVRFTGGEPLLRSDLALVMRAWREALPDGELALTTNGLLLERKLDGLLDAGLDRVHVHLDSLDPDRCRRVMGGGDPSRVLRAVEKALSKGLVVKLNVVVQLGVNDDELASFLDVAHAMGVEVRFIEMMDTGSAGAHVASTFIAGATVLARLMESHPHEQLERARPSAPAERHRVVETGQVFGLIASDTRPFCDACDRIRLSAEGAFRTCLYEPPGQALVDELRSGLSDTAITDRIQLAISNKTSWHPSQVRERRAFSMADVGG